VKHFLLNSWEKKKLIAETGAGQHGVALATAGAYFNIKTEIHMGEVDIAKEKPNVTRMKILGADVISVTRGTKTLKDAVDSAFEAYLAVSIILYYNKSYNMYDYDYDYDYIFV
jgi:tryptophan synthase beta subunit